MRQQYDEVKRMSPPQIAAVTTVGVCALAFALKLILATQSGMIVVWAAAWHVLAGLLYALLMLGILYTPDEQPIGDVSEAEREYLQYQSGVKLNVRRYEAVLALLGSAGLLAVAYFVFTRVLGAQPAAPKALSLTLAGLAAVVIGMQFAARFTERIGVLHEAPGLVATSFHARTDGFATILALLGVITSAMGFSLERYFAGLVGLLLVADAAQLFVDATRRLVGLDEDAPTAQLPFWVRLRGALRGYAEQMPPIVRWLLRYDDALDPNELRRARRTAGAVVAVLYLLSGFRTVQPGEIAAVKLFGRYIQLAEPGPVYALWPFASARVESIDRIQRVTVGFKTATTWAPHVENRPFAEMRWEPQEDSAANEIFTVDNVASKFMLGDTTLVETHAVVTYRVRHDNMEQIRGYLFGVEDPAALVHTVAREALQSVFLKHGLDEALVEERAGLEAHARDLIQERLDVLGIAIQIERVLIRSIHPPVEVLDAFIEVASAQELMTRDIHLAEAEAVQKTRSSEGRAQRMQNMAEAEKTRRISQAIGQTAEFRQLYRAAVQDNAALRTRMRIEAEEQVLSNRALHVLPPRGSGTRTTVWLNNEAGATGPPGLGPGGAPPAPAAPAAPAGPEAEGTEQPAAPQAGAPAGAPAGG